MTLPYSSALNRRVLYALVAGLALVCLWTGIPGEGQNAHVPVTLYAPLGLTNPDQSMGIAAFRGKFEISGSQLDTYQQGAVVLKNHQAYHIPIEAMVEEARTYAEAAKGSKVTEVSIDDFGGWYSVARYIHRESILSQILDAVKTTNPHLKFGITVYEDELSAAGPRTITVVPLRERMRIDVVRLYTHSRPNYVELPRYVSEAKAEFRNAQVVVGVYDYDRREDERPFQRPRTEDKEVEMFTENLRSACSLWQSGQAVGIELFPGTFGMEKKWFTRAPIIAQVTIRMHQIAVPILRECSR